MPLALLAPAPCGAQRFTVQTFAGATGGGGYEDGPAVSARFSGLIGVAVDAGGAIFVADFNNHVIRRVSPAGVVSTYAGAFGIRGSVDGPLGAARFDNPIGLAFDAAGNLWVADFGTNLVRRVTPGGAVTTVAGLAGVPGSTDGTGAAARFRGLNRGMVFDAAGNLYVAENQNHTIRRIAPDGTVSTFAGTAGQSGSADGTGAAARFNAPRGLAIDSQGNLYVAEGGNHLIRKISGAGVVTTLAGTAGQSGTTNGTGAAARFNDPRGVCVDSSGNVWVADAGNNVVRKITPAGEVTTVAGAGPGAPGSVDGTGAAARFWSPGFIAAEASGSFLVTDATGNGLRRVTPAGVVTTVAGPNPEGNVDATGTAARFSHPEQIATDGAGNVYVADAYNATVRKVTPSGTVSTLAGSPGETGSADGTGSAARFAYPFGIAAGPSGSLVVADLFGHTIRGLTGGGVVTTLAGTAGAQGSADGVGAAASFRLPAQPVYDSTGTLFIPDNGNHTIRKMTPDRVVSTFAGSAGQAGTADGTGAAARFSSPRGLAIDASNNLYVTDSGNYLVRKITPAGVVTTVAGKAGTSGVVDGPLGQASFGFPAAIAVDASGTLFVADTNVLRRVTPAGAITTVAGVTSAGGGQDGTGAGARLSTPEGVAVDPSGRVFVSNWGSQKIVVVTPALPDTATIDAASGPVGAARRLDCPAQQATAWQWSLLQTPPGSAAQVSSPTSRNPTFTPDLPGRYLLRVRASNGAGVSYSEVPLLATTAPTVAVRTVPIVLDVVGKGEARFASELTLVNRGTTVATVSLAYTSSIGSGSGTAAETLQPGQQRVIGDAISYLRGKGIAIPNDPPQGGSLQATFFGVSSLEAAFAGARTTAPSGTGRAGLAYAGLAPEEAASTGVALYGLRETAADRSNLALVNAGTGGPIKLRVELFPASGGASTTIADVTLEPGAWTQIGSVLGNAGLTNGYARVSRVSGSDPFVAYAVFNDNVTSDGSYVSALRTDRLAEPQVLPVLVETPTFDSELVLTNPSASVATVTMTYVESLTPAGVAAAVTEVLQPGEQKIIPGAINYLRGKGATVGARGAGSYAGALTVTFRSPSGTPLAGFTGARTGAPASGGGQYGLFYAGTTLSEAAGDEALVYGLVQNATGRSNLALVNLGTNGGSLTLRYEVYDGETGAKAAEDQVTLGPGGWKQVNAILDLAGISNGYVRIVRVSGDERFVAYGVSNDNGTNDGSYVTMSVVR